MPLAIADTFTALADPTRLAIVERLAREPGRVTDIAAPFAMSLNAISKHLKVLERAGLVRRTWRGREHHFRLNPQPLHQLGSWVQRMEQFWNTRLDALERLVGERDLGDPTP